MRTIFSFLLFAALSATATAACAHGRSSYDVDLVCAGEPCIEATHHGTRYVLGEYGERYSIRVSNRTDRWTEAVVTVDGRDVLNGSSGSYSNRGYLIAPYGSIDIDGFRINTSEVAAFRFTSVGDSYAGRVDGGKNAGVVGVAFFPESRPKRRAYLPKDKRPDPYPRKYGFDFGGAGGDDVAEAAPSADAATESSARGKASSGYSYRPPRQQQNLGTQYGERRWSTVTEVDFRRANSSSPAAVLKIRYDDRAGLLSKGIEVPWREYVPPPPPYVPPYRFVPPPPDPFPSY